MEAIATRLQAIASRLEATVAMHFLEAGAKLCDAKKRLVPDTPCRSGSITRLDQIVLCKIVV